MCWPPSSWLCMRTRASRRSRNVWPAPTAAAAATPAVPTTPRPSWRTVPPPSSVPRAATRLPTPSTPSWAMPPTTAPACAPPSSVRAARTAASGLTTRASRPALLRPPLRAAPAPAPMAAWVWATAPARASLTPSTSSTAWPSSTAKSAPAARPAP